MEDRNPLPAETDRRLDNIIRLGTIAAVDHARALCRVQTGGLLTTWLPWFARRAGNTRTWCPPTVGEQAMVLSPSGEPGAGLVLTGLYTAAHDQPSANADDHITLYPDGAFERYNHKLHRYTLDIPDGGLIKIRCGPSTIEMDGTGIRLNAPRIDLN